MESLTLNTLNKQLLSKRLLSHSPTVSSRSYLVAYSGGMDSHVLLYLMSGLLEQADQTISLRALHVHHGLQKEADSWTHHCQKTCDELNIPLELVYLDLNTNEGESLEAVARQGRYQALHDSLQQDEVLLTAHHQRDQAETFLLQLFRGAGVQGLASMPEVTDFSQGQHIRPLLAERYASLLNYAKENKLNYIEDPSNQDNSFDRNFLRNQIFPQLREHWAGLDKTISRSARIQSETKQLLDDMAQKLLIALESENKQTIDINKLLNLSTLEQKLVLRYWLTRRGFKAPSEKKLHHILSDVLRAKEDAQPLVTWQGAEVRRYKNQLFCNPPLHYHDNTQVLDWNGAESFVIESLGISIPLNVLDDLPVQNYPVTVRFRQGGEKIHLANHAHTQSLKKVLNEAGIPPWLRDRLPLIYLGDELIHIIGLEK